MTIRRLIVGEIANWKAHGGRVEALALSPNGAELASGGKTGVIKRWRVADGELLLTMNDHRDVIYQLDYSPDGTTLVSCGSDNTVGWCEAATGKPIGTFEGNTSGVRAAIFAGDGQALYTGSHDCTLRRIDVKTGKDRLLATLDVPIRTLALDRNKKTMAVASWKDSKVRLWDLAAEKEIFQLDIESPVANALAFDPKGKLLAVGCESSRLEVWDLSGRRKVHALALKQPILGLAFSADGKLLVTAGGIWDDPEGTCEIKVWDPANGKLLVTFGSNLDCAYSVVVTADGKTCFTGHSDGTIRKWRLPVAGK